MTHIVEFYRDAKGECRWRLRSKRNRKIVAESGEGYERPGACVKAWRKVQIACAASRVAEDTPSAEALKADGKKGKRVKT